jgi:hypothetical protein
VQGGEAVVQRLLLGTQTSGSAKDYVLVAGALRQPIRTGMLLPGALLGHTQSSHSRAPRAHS